MYPETCGLISAVVDPSSVASHSLITGTLRSCTSTTFTAGGGGFGGGGLWHAAAAPATTKIAASPAVPFTDTHYESHPAAIKLAGANLKLWSSASHMIG